MPNIRHDLDPALVREQIAKAIAGNELDRIRLKAEAEKTLQSYQRAVIEGTTAQWSKVPQGPDYVDPMIDRWNKEQLEYYATVRVIEMEKPVLTHNGEWNSFILSYGDKDDATVSSGTGPFSTLEKAKNWFLNSGR